MDNLPVVPETMAELPALPPHIVQQMREHYQTTLTGSLSYAMDPDLEIKIAYLAGQISVVEDLESKIKE